MTSTQPKESGLRRRSSSSSGGTSGRNGSGTSSGSSRSLSFTDGAAKILDVDLLSSTKCVDIVVALVVDEFVSSVLLKTKDVDEVLSHDCWGCHGRSVVMMSKRCQELFRNEN